MDIHETMEPAPFNKPNIHGSFLSINIIFPNQILGFPYLEIHIMNNGSFGSFWPPRKHCENACLCLMKWELIGVIDLAQGAQLLNGWDIYIYRDTIVKYI